MASASHLSAFSSEWAPIAFSEVAGNGVDSFRDNPKHVVILFATFP